MTNINNIVNQGFSSKFDLLPPDKLAKAKETAENFEAFFLSRMMESMFEGVATDGVFGGGHAEKVYRSLLLDQYGQEMAKSGGIGVKDYVMNAILQMQEEDSSVGSI